MYFLYRALTVYLHDAAFCRHINKTHDDDDDEDYILKQHLPDICEIRTHADAIVQSVWDG